MLIGIVNRCFLRGGRLRFQSSSQSVNVTAAQAKKKREPNGDEPKRNKGEIRRVFGLHDEQAIKEHDQPRGTVSQPLQYHIEKGLNLLFYIRRERQIKYLHSDLVYAWPQNRIRQVCCCSLEKSRPEQNADRSREQTRGQG